MPKLTDEDSRAVDLLLDPPAAPLTPEHPEFQQRVARIEQLLGLLKVLPPIDLPKGLLTRLLDSIEPPTPASPFADTDSPTTTQPYL